MANLQKKQIDDTVLKNQEKSKLKSLDRFYENLGLSYEDSHYYIHPFGISRKKKLLKLLSPNKNDIICDLGCGDGNLSKDLIKQVKEVYGTDISPTRVERARKNGIKAFCYDVCSTHFKSNYFDKIICSEVIEHVIEPRELLRETYRLLKGNGTVVLTVPYNQVIEKTILQIPKKELEQMNFYEIIKKYNIPDAHLNSFSKEEIISIMEEEGFKVKQVDFTHKYEPIFKSKKIYHFISYIKLRTRFIKKSKRINSLFDIFIFSAYRKKKEKGHIIVCACKKNH